jgi:RsiW-degrading membrane proteinase PrsW (M82 family)
MDSGSDEPVGTDDRASEDPASAENGAERDAAGHDGAGRDTAGDDGAVRDIAGDEATDGPVWDPADSRDPIQQLDEDETDRYDVTFWENRTPLDGLAVFVHRWLRRLSRGAVIVVGTALVFGQLVLGAATFARFPELGVLTVLSVVPAAFLAFYVWQEDPTLKQPLASLVVTFLLGLVFAGFAAVANDAMQPVFGGSAVGLVLFFVLVVGPGEEAVKWLAVRLYAYERSDFDAVIDGAVYGAVAGLGFATIENTIYIVQGIETALDGGEAVGPAAIGVTSVRSLAGPGHVIYSAFAGYYLGLAKFNPENRGPIVVKGLLLASGIHATYNVSVAFLPGAFGMPSVTFLLLIVVFDGVVIYALYRKLSRYRRTYHWVVGDARCGAPERSGADGSED